ncbi:MAG: hypothetical protein AB7S36_08845 [Planctomycetota bacterium]
MHLAMPFLLPGAILIFGGYPLRRVVHFLANAVVLSVGLTALLLQFNIAPEMPAVVPGVSVLGGLGLAALLIHNKAQFVGRMSTGICAGALFASVLLFAGMLIPPTNWGGVILYALGTAGSTATAIGPPTVVMAPLEPLLIDPAVAPWIALGAGGLLGLISIANHYRLESAMISLLGGVLVGFGLGHAWIILAAFALGTTVQWISQRPKTSGTTAEERATMRWKVVNEHTRVD